MTSFKKNRTAILIFFGSLVILFFLPVLLGIRTFPTGDFSNLYLPYNLFFRNELAALHLPIWNPYAYSGHPFLADPQAVVFYPVNDLLTLISLPWTTLAARFYWLQLEAILHIFLAGVFTWLFVRELTKNQMAGIMAGTIFMFSGFLNRFNGLAKKSCDRYFRKRRLEIKLWPNHRKYYKKQIVDKKRGYDYKNCLFRKRSVCKIDYHTNPDCHKII